MTAWTPPASAQDAVLPNIPSWPSSFPALCSRISQLKPALWNNVRNIWLSRIKDLWISKDENIRPVSCHGLSPCAGGFFVHLVFTLLSLLFQPPRPQTKLNKEAEAVTNTPGWLHLTKPTSLGSCMPCPEAEPSLGHHGDRLTPTPARTGTGLCLLQDQQLATPSHPTVFLELSFSYVVLPAAHLSVWESYFLK